MRNLVVFFIKSLSNEHVVFCWIFLPYPITFRIYQILALNKKLGTLTLNKIIWLSISRFLCHLFVYYLFSHSEGSYILLCVGTLILFIYSYLILGDVLKVLRNPIFFYYKIYRLNKIIFFIIIIGKVFWVDNFFFYFFYLIS